MKVGNPTSRDIAELAGVSQATVSRALRNSPLVKPETRQRIQQIAKELNYFVNRNAASLRTQQSNTIALLLFNETEDADARINPFFLSMLGHITRSAADQGYDVLVSMQQQSDDWHIEYQASNRADGLILLGYGDYMAYREKLDALTRANTRFMIWGPIVRDLRGHSVGCDNVRGGVEATRHLIKLGRRRIAFVGDASERSPEQVDRYNGYRKALHSAGFPIDESLIAYAHNRARLGRAAVESLLDKNVPFDAVFASTDLIALGAMRALQERKIAVPDAVSVVGYDDQPVAALVTPALTTVQQNIREASEGLVNAIVALIRGEGVKSTLIAPRLIVRDSCGATPPAG